MPAEVRAAVTRASPAASTSARPSLNRRRRHPARRSRTKTFRFDLVDFAMAVIPNEPAAAGESKDLLFPLSAVFSTNIGPGIAI